MPKEMELPNGMELVVHDDGVVLYHNTTALLYLNSKDASKLGSAIHRHYCTGGYNCPCVEAHIADGGCREARGTR